MFVIYRYLYLMSCCLLERKSHKKANLIRTMNSLTLIKYVFRFSSTVFFFGKEMFSQRPFTNALSQQYFLGAVINPR